MSTTTLIQAIRTGNLEAVKRLIDQGAQVNQAKSLLSDWLPQPASPLLEAVEQAQLEIVAALLEAGADANDTTSGTTALKLAVRKNNPELVKLLLVWGALPDKKGKQDGTTPLLKAALYSQIEVVRILLENHADPDIVLTNPHLYKVRGSVIQMLIDAGGAASPEVIKMLADGQARP